MTLSETVVLGTFARTGTSGRDDMASAWPFWFAGLKGLLHKGLVEAAPADSPQAGRWCLTRAGALELAEMQQAWEEPTPSWL